MNHEECGYEHSAEFYDSIPVYSERTDIDFYIREAQSAKGSVLELGCGTGRILIPIALSGIRITGLDNSETMLDLCRKKLTEIGESAADRVELTIGDMRDFSLGRKFNLITVPFRAFQHLLAVEDQLSCLECVLRHLSEGGRFILDLFNPSMKFILDDSRKSEFGDEEPFTMPDGRRITRRMRNPSLSLSEQIIDCEIIYYVDYPDGSRERFVHPFRLRYLFRYEAEHLLERVGFTVTEVLGDYDGNPFGCNWPGELVLKAVRK